MSRHSQNVNAFLEAGFDRAEALEKADQITLNKVLDEDEEYLREQEALEDEELEELDGYNDDAPDFDDDEEDEINFEDGFTFSDDEEDDY